jgi:hypothetical protein
VGFEREEFEHLSWCSFFASLHIVEVSNTTISSSERPWACYFWRGDLLDSLEVGAPLTSSWKIVKRSGILLRAACEVVVELAISGVEKALQLAQEDVRASC